ncbi:MAG TPA: TldD/PmbA family protein [Bacillota bacterium]|nr:TldD/PmbA family protein [Bacillota bacterium]
MINVEKLFEKAKDKGFVDVQIFKTGTRDLSIEVFDGELEKYEIADTSSLTIKAIKDGKMVTFVTEVMDDEDIDMIVDAMLKNVSVITSVDEAEIYAGDEKYEELTGMYNPEMENLDIADKIDLVKKLDSFMHKEDSRVKIVECEYAESTKSVLLQNTKGLKLTDHLNSAYFGASAIVNDGKDQRTGFDLVISNDMADFKPEELSNAIVTDAIKALGSKPVPSAKYPIVFDRNAIAVLFSAFQRIFSADNVQKSMSLLKGKLNTKIGSDKVNIVDDPFLKKSNLSRSFDDEGVATKYKMLVEAGVLKTYLHNLVTAKKDKIQPTGNGFGGSVAPTNFMLLPGQATKDELIASLSNGLYITDVQGAHAGANPVSGDFSLQAMGFVVKDGKVAEPVALITVASNFIDFLNDIEEVGNDVRTSFYGITCPSVKVGPLSVSGL